MEEDHTHYYGVDSAEKHVSVKKALDEFLSQIKPVSSEIVKAELSLHRVLHEDVRSRVDVPLRARSTRDGYAVRIAQEISLAESSFKVVGDVRIGIAPKISMEPGEAVRIATGSYIPRGANAVLMKEYSETSENTLVAKRAIEHGENILQAGEDISRNSVILEKGEMLRPQHIALLSQLGIRNVKVFKKPKVAFFSTGDELADSKRSKKEGKIYDSNRPFIHSMILELGLQPVDLGIVTDNYAKIRGKIISGLKSDALILSAGSSVGERDYVSRAAESVRSVRMMFHGVAMRPSSPTGLATCKGKPFVLLPGFPTSAVVSFFVFAVPAILKLSGSTTTSLPLIKTRILERYEGKKGITHFVRVKVESEDEEYTASVVKPTEAFYSSWMGSANGIAVINEESSPVEPGQLVNVFLIGALHS